MPNKFKLPQLNRSNPLEIENPVGNVLRDVKNQINPLGNEFFQQILGLNEHAEKSPAPKTNKSQLIEMQPGQAIDLRPKRKPESIEKPRNLDLLPGIDYRRDILRGQEQRSERETHEIRQKLEEIKSELMRLVKSSSILQAEFGEVAAGQAPVSPGKYHINFFEWVLTIIKQARIKVEDSGAWLASMKNKKGKKGYWDMFKKHGTSFGLSNERNVATQTG